MAVDAPLPKLSPRKSQNCTPDEMSYLQAPQGSRSNASRANHMQGGPKTPIHERAKQFLPPDDQYFMDSSTHGVQRRVRENSEREAHIELIRKQAEQNKKKKRRSIGDLNDFQGGKRGAEGANTATNTAEYHTNDDNSRKRMRRPVLSQAAQTENANMNRDLKSAKPRKKPKASARRASTSTTLPSTSEGKRKDAQTRRKSSPGKPKNEGVSHECIPIFVTKPTLRELKKAR